MKEGWTDKLRQKLAGHQMVPPDGLWESIGEQMGFKEEVPAPRSASYVWLRWAAAAVVLALAGLFAFYQSEDRPAAPIQQEMAKAVTATTDSLVPVPVAEVARSVTPSRLVSLAVTDAVNANAETSLSESVPNSSESDSPESEMATHSDKSEQQTIYSPDPVSVSSARPKSIVVKSHRSNSGKWTVGVNASGGLMASANTAGTERVVLHNSYPFNFGLIDNYQSLNGYYSDGYTYIRTDYKWEHHLPVRFGLDLQYRLSERLALLSGVNYTYLYSELSVPLYQGVTYDQRLHYLGVPLGVAWQLWSTRHFGLYLSGEAMLEKCVRFSADNGGDMDIKPWQWSVNVAAGAEYAIMRQLGVYLEPSLGYYFDDGTSLEHYYKKHPLAPSIEFGLRLHLNK